MARKKQPSGAGFDLAREMIEKLKAHSTMTPTQQDRLLAERILRFIDDWTLDTNMHQMQIDDLSSLLAEAREAQHKASWAMALEAVVQAVKKSSIQGLAKTHLYAAFTRIPTPPITNEGE